MYSIGLDENRRWGNDSINARADGQMLARDLNRSLILLKRTYLSTQKKKTPLLTLSPSVIFEGFVKAGRHTHSSLTGCLSAYWDKDKIRLCLPSNATLALGRLYPMQCVSFTLAPSVGKGRFGSFQGFLLSIKAVFQDKT